jgi:hypothetical protein
LPNTLVHCSNAKFTVTITLVRPPATPAAASSLPSCQSESWSLPTRVPFCRYRFDGLCHRRWWPAKSSPGSVGNAQHRRVFGIASDFRNHAVGVAGVADRSRGNYTRATSLLSASPHLGRADASHSAIRLAIRHPIGSHQRQHCLLPTFDLS